MYCRRPRTFSVPRTLRPPPSLHFPFLHFSGTNKKSLFSQPSPHRHHGHMQKETWHFYFFSNCSPRIPWINACSSHLPLVCSRSARECDFIGFPATCSRRYCLMCRKDFTGVFSMATVQSTTEFLHANQNWYGRRGQMGLKIQGLRLELYRAMMTLTGAHERCLLLWLQQIHSNSENESVAALYVNPPPRNINFCPMGNVVRCFTILKTKKIVYFWMNQRCALFCAFYKH